MTRYDLICSDPPWNYRDPDAVRHFPGTRSSPADQQYDCMPIEALEALRTQLDEWSAEDCILAMWGCWPKLDDYMRLGAAWGFQWLTCGFVWVKTWPGSSEDDAQSRLCVTPGSMMDARAVCGLGFYTRSSTEFCGLWRRGKPKMPEDRAVKQVLHEDRREHSRKPDEAYRRLVQMWPKATRLEMFARTRRPGWDAWGNEVEKF